MVKHIIKSIQYTIFILALLLISTVSASEISYFLDLDLNLTTGKLSLNDIDLIEGFENYIDIGFQTHKLELYSFQNQVLNKYYIYYPSPDFGFFPLNESSTPPKFPQSYELGLTMPYYPNGKMIKITNLDTNEILEIDVSKFAQPSEEIVPEITEKIEIIEEEPFIEEKIEIDEKEEKTNYFYIYTILIIFLIIIIFLILFKNNRKIYK